jgi:hypothetical protein
MTGPRSDWDFGRGFVDLGAVLLGINERVKYGNPPGNQAQRGNDRRRAFRLRGFAATH